MKITNNEIRVELPPEMYKEFTDSVSDESNNLVVSGYEEASRLTEELNPPLVVDVEALAQTIFERSIYWEIHGSWENLPCGYKETLRESAQHLAANLDKWLIEKKEDRTDEQ